ncbi:Protein MAIN-LIKE 1 [Glycine soja]
MHIMVRTRGLGRVLGSVIGRALGRQDNHHSDDVLQRQRPTASAHRQREAAPIPEDDPIVTEDLHAHAEEEAVDDAERFPGGPHDPSVLTDFYGDHVAVIVCNGEECPELKLSSHGRKAQKFGRPAPEIERLWTLAIRDLYLLFVERWHKKTSSFHLPVGELTITLDDVASLLHLPIIGAFRSFETLHVDEVSFGDEARAETTQCHGAYVCLSLLRDIYQSKCEAIHWTVATRAYLLHLCFPRHELEWKLRMGSCRPSSYCWIYEHFPSVVESLSNPDYDEVSPRACRWIATKASLKSLPASTYWKCLDGLTILDVCWMPYGDHCVVRDFDLIVRQVASDILRRGG